MDALYMKDTRRKLEKLAPDIARVTEIHRVLFLTVPWIAG
ncbi:hypothetical protein USDA257_c62010 [Sinorhizobium fredii USDA 257]|uniref:Uncharacterized protein n=1 Tax=Sinorhizobium fredii (strain USDA 257) TaxID=1185652 RepID=I3XFP2_SINF2|nr:hypothetical protein USDA257_c62010 [Sinorhizobium fredii USDA 257]